MSNSLDSAALNVLIGKCEADVAQTGQRLTEADAAYKVAVRSALLDGSSDESAQADAISAANAHHRATDRLQAARQLLTEAIAAEKDAADAAYRVRLLEILKRLDEKALKIDAMAAELAEHLVEMRGIAYNAQPIIRSGMGLEAPNPGLVIDAAPKVAGFIRTSIGGNPTDHEPFAKVLADKYAAQVRTAAGITSDE